MENLKELARDLYYRNVLPETMRENFDTKLETHTVEDRRESGWYCGYCQKFHASPIAFHSTDYVIFPRGETNTIWIVNRHYDGCRGWD